MAAPLNFTSVQGVTVNADQINTLVQWTTNVAALRTFSGANSNMTVYLLGQVTPDDGGQGSFYWNASSPGPDDGINVIVPTGNLTGAWIRLGSSAGSFLPISGGTMTGPLILSGNAVSALQAVPWQQLQGSFGQPFSGSLTESHSVGAATFSIQGLTTIAFRDATAATGDVVTRATTGAAITIPSGATLGASNGVAFRIWFVLVDTGSGVDMGVVNCWNGSSLFALRETILYSPTAISGAADSANVIYTTSGETTKPIRILGFAEYSSGLATAGTWNASPTKIQLFAPGISLPGETMQVVTGSTTSPTTTTGTSFVNTNLSAAISLNGAANLVKVSITGVSEQTVAGAGALVTAARGSTPIGPIIQNQDNTSNTQVGSVAIVVYDAPGTVSSTTYRAMLKSNVNSNLVAFLVSGGSTVGASITLEEIAA